MSQTDAEGNITSYGYDLMDREISRDNPGGILYEQNTYDAMGRLVRQIDGAAYSYDLAGRQTMVKTPEGAVQQFMYDALGSLTATTDAMGNTTRFTVDAWGRKTHITKADHSECFGYYPDGKLRYAIGGGMRYDYTYDCMGRLTGKSAGGRSLLQYTYDPNGNRTGNTDPTGKRTEYTYDYADRLMEVRDNVFRVPDPIVRQFQIITLKTAWQSDG